MPMPEIVIYLRADQSPPASPPEPGNLTVPQLDANPTNLKAAADYLEANKLNTSAVALVTDTLTTLLGSDQLVIRRAGVFYLTTMAAIAAYVGGAPVETPPAPFAPSDFSVLGGAGSIGINITALPDDGGSAITLLEYRLDGGAPVALSGLGTGLRTITSVPAGTYAVQVRASNAIGAGEWSAAEEAVVTEAPAGKLNIVNMTPFTSNPYGTEVSLTIPAVGVGNSLIIAAINITPDTRVDGGTTDAALATLFSNYSHFLHLPNITDGRTSITLRTFDGVGDPAATVTDCVVIEVDAESVAAATTVDGNFGSTGAAVSQAFTGTIANAFGLASVSLSNPTIMSGGDGWVPVDAITSLWSPFGYNEDLGAAGAENAAFTLAESRLYGIVAFAYARGA